MPASRRPGRASPSSPPGTPSEHPHSDTCSRLVLLPMIVFSNAGSTSRGGPHALVLTRRSHLSAARRSRDHQHAQGRSRRWDDSWWGPADAQGGNMPHRTDLDPTSTAQHPRPQPRESPLHVPTRALLLPLKSCRTSTSQRLETGRPSSGQRAAGSGTRLWSQTDRTDKGGAETIRRKEPPVRRRPTPGGGQAGRQADDKEGGGGGGRGRTTASASPAAVGFHGIVAQGREKTPPIVLEGYQDGMQVNFLSNPSTAATPVPRPPTDPLALVAARPPHPPLM